MIIIGAGPAGAMASVFLSKAGITHVIIEKEIFPRDKICGDAFSGKTRFVIKRADPKWLDEIFENRADNLPCYALLFSAPNGKTFEIPFNTNEMPPGHSTGFISRRIDFDDFLFGKTASAFAKIFQGASVRAIARHHGSVQVSMNADGKDYIVEAPMIIGADGDKSVVRKILKNNNGADKTDCVGLRAYYKNVAGFNQNNAIELHFLPEVLPGYLWMFPLTNGLANVGIGMPSDIIREKKINLREVMLKAIENNPLIRDRFAEAVLTDKIKGWGLATCMKEDAISGENFMLTGDAASLIDPFSGEGIGNALYSGMIAASAAERCIRENNFRAEFVREHYDEVLYKHIGAELKNSVLLRRLCGRPRLINFVVKKARRSAALRKVLTSLMNGEEAERELKKVSFYLKVLMNR